MAKHDVEAFHFPERHAPWPELTDEVERLTAEGGYKSALDVILRHLRAEGRSAEAFRLARELLHLGQRRTPDPRVTEPVTPEQHGNPYFAPVATECARCARFWYSGHTLAEDMSLAVSNPIGVQCQTCRYSLCRECFDPRNGHCPEGCGGELGVPVLPTGRPRRMPVNEFTDKLEHVLILWRDAPVGQEEADHLVDLACAWQDRGGISVRSQVNPADRKDGEVVERRMGLVLVGLYERHEMISEGGLLHRTRVVPIESPGRGRRLVFVTAAPETGPASRLSGPVTHLLFDEDEDENTDGAGVKPRKRRWFRRRR